MRSLAITWPNCLKTPRAPSRTEGVFTAPFSLPMTVPLLAYLYQSGMPWVVVSHTLISPDTIFFLRSATLLK